MDVKTLDLPTLRFVLDFLRSERDCYDVDKYAEFDEATGTWQTCEEANKAWRETMDGLIQWTAGTIGVVEAATASPESVL